MASAVTLTLGLGLGASATIFNVVNGVLLKPLPFEDSDRLVYVGRTWNEQDPTAASLPDFIDWEERLATIQGLAAAQASGFVLPDGRTPERIQASRVSPTFFTTLGAQASIGRVLSDGDPDGEDIAVLSAGIWQRRWGADPGIIGRTFTMVDERSDEAQAFTVVGVMPAGFKAPAALSDGGSDPEVWVPLPRGPDARGASRTRFNVHVFGRLVHEGQFGVAEEEVDALSRAMTSEFPDAYVLSGDTVGIGVTSLLRRTVGETRTGILLLFGATGILLLVGCANVVNLLLARTTSRSPEMAVRSSRGAGRFRILRPLITESSLLGLLGGAVGVALAFAGVSLLRVVAPIGFPRLEEISLDLWVMGYTLGLATLVGVLVGIPPALLGSTAPIDQYSSRSTGGRHSTWLSRVLVGSQIAMALVLCVGAALFANSLLRLNRVELGIDEEDLMFMEVRLPGGYDPTERATFFSSLTASIRDLAGVRSAGLIGDLPLGTIRSALPLTAAETGERELTLTATHLVGEGYFSAVGMRLVSGRGFSSSDGADAPAVAVVNETLAERFWPDEDPIGKYLHRSLDADASPFTVVGVVNDVHQRSLASIPLPQLYLPYPQFTVTRNMYIVARTSAPLSAMIGPMQNALRDLDPSLPVATAGTMEGRVAESLSESRFRVVLIGFFAVVALLLAAIGIYSATAYSVGRRTREMGIRIAMGAEPRGLIALVVWQTSRLIMVAIGAGIMACIALSRLIATFVFGITPTDSPTIVLVSGFFGFVALFACYLPARRMTKADPLDALRSE
jgi:putative ABC transport system permease protein